VGHRFVLDNSDRHPRGLDQENVSMTRDIAACSRFLTLTQCGERPAR
jgi:hypothetical protein